MKKAKPKVKAAAPVPAPEKTVSDVPAARVQMYLRSRFNPIRNLSPELLSHYLDRLKIGWLREITLIWDAIQERDDKVSLVSALRRKAVARFDYQIEVIDDLADSDKATAAEHKAALEYFYSHLSTTSAIDENEQGGVKLLIKQMMDAVGKKYSVHEIVWQPQADGSLTAQMRWVPIWFFENTTGKLRYIPTEGEAYGLDLEEGGWMVTVGDGLMIATCIAYMFKTLPLRDWVTYCERNGMPAFLGKTNASQNSPQWTAMVAAVESIAADYAAVMNTSESIEALDLKGSQANLPYEPLVQLINAAIASLWRGGDLSTQSSGKQSQGRGSNRQEDEAEIILDDDVEMISETLRMNVDRYVIQNQFGDDQPLARFTIIRPPKEATAQDLAVDQFLIGSSAPLGVDDAYKRYGRVAPRPGEALLVAPQQPEQIPQGLANIKAVGIVHDAGEAEMARLIVNSKPEIAAGLALTLQPMAEHYRRALDVPDDQLAGSIDRFRASLPALLKEMNVKPEIVPQLSSTIATALLGEVTQKAPAK